MEPLDFCRGVFLCFFIDHSGLDDLEDIWNFYTKKLCSIHDPAS